MKTKSLIVITAALACLFVTDSTFAQSWFQTSAPTNTWTSVAISADGASLIAVGRYYIYTSTNYGSTWISNNAPATFTWTSVASSSDGTKLVAAGGGAVYTNSGTSWAFAYASPRSGPSYEQNITSVASSADGSKLIAASSFGDPIYSPKPMLYVSANSGASWVSATNSASDGQGWLSVATSADGSKMAASTLTGGIFTSANAGGTWASNSSPQLASLATSADGNTLLGVNPLGIWISTDAGGLWAPKIGGPVITNKIGCSTNANVWFGLGNTNIYSSYNAGATWVTNTARLTNWVAIAVAKDGTRAVAAASGGGIYTLNPPPILIANSGNAISLLWSTNYPPAAMGLTENTNLTGAGWAAVPTPPAVANAYYEVTLPATNSQLFFRLQSP